MLNNKIHHFTILLAFIMGFSSQSVALEVLHQGIPLVLADRTQSGPNYDSTFQQMDQRKWQNYSHSSRTQQSDVRKNQVQKDKTTQYNDMKESEKYMENHD